MFGFLRLLSLNLVAVAGILHGRSSHPIRLEYPPPEPPHHKCKVSAGESCSLGSLAPNEVTLVYPDPVTSHARCIFSTNQDFAFQVVPRSADKLLVHFEGGGACWNRFTTTMGACWRDQIWAFPLNHTIFDGESPDNPYRNYTLVWVNACSGDLHCGNVTRDYRDDNKKPVEQRGFYNTRSVLDWLNVNLGNTRLQSLALQGESAGAIGVQVWAETLLNELKYEKASVLADSYAAVFPKGFQGPVFKSLGVCETGIFKRRPHLLRLCRAENITVSDVFDHTIMAFPDVTFAMINSKYDIGQMAFDTVASTSIRQFPHSPQDYHREMLTILQRYNQHPNFVSYLVTSANHVFSNGYLSFRRLQDAATVAKAYAPKLSLVFGDRKQAMVENYVSTSNGVLDWIAKLPLEPGESIESHCELLDARHIAAVDNYPVKHDQCDPRLSNKVFTAPLRE